MMRINQFSNASMFQTQTAQMQGNNRAANQSFKTSLQNNSQAIQGMQTGNNQPGQITGQQNNIQPAAPEGFSGFSGVINMPNMPGGEMPSMPDGQTPPEMPDGEMPPAMPEMPDGEMPPAMPEIPEGEEPPAKPEGEEEIDGGMGMQRPDDLPEIPAGEEPPAKPDESDGGMGMPPSGMPGGFSGMGGPRGMQSRPESGQFGGSFSGMNGMNSFNAMSFAMNMR